MAMPEANFQVSSVADIASAFFENGCVLLRDCVRPEQIDKLKPIISDLYTELQQVHVFEQNMLDYGHNRLSTYVFNNKHYELLEAIFGDNRYCISDHATHARRVSAPNATENWQQPLGYHLDAGFHTLNFTVNFWIPFQDCGEDAPSLGVMRMSIADMLGYSNFDGKPEENRGLGVWMFHHFKPIIGEAAAGDRAANIDLIEELKDRHWTPHYKLGDAMIISNYTLHGTHSTATMKKSRENMELRFSSDVSAQKVLADRAGKNSSLTTLI